MRKSPINNLLKLIKLPSSGFNFHNHIVYRYSQQKHGARLVLPSSHSAINKLAFRFSTNPDKPPADPS